MIVLLNGVESVRKCFVIESKEPEQKFFDGMEWWDEPEVVCLFSSREQAETVADNNNLLDTVKILPVAVSIREVVEEQNA